MSASVALLPDNAPFTPAQRAWLDGWIAGALVLLPASFASPAFAPPSPGPVEEEFPWHDMSLGLEDRMRLAAGQPKARVLMAAMAQQDCGQCGYLCKTYAEAIADGREPSLTRCTPGGKETARALKDLMEEAPPSLTPGAAVAQAPAASPTETQVALLRQAAPLNRVGSAKDTRHVVLEFADAAGARYEVGDSLGVHACNDPVVVDSIITCLGAAPDTAVECADGIRRPLWEALSAFCDIARPSDEAVEVLSSRAPDADHSQRLQAIAEGYPGAEPQDADLLDLLIAFPSARPPVQELVSALGPLRPRLYSISSSLKAAPGEVHLTVAAVRWQQRGRLRKGVASTFLADRGGTEGTVPVFVQPAHGFRLPRSGDAPVVMIGPGTGVAPFRAFLQERRAMGARGRNWLFFGDQRRAFDFLYEDEIAAFARDGLLTRLDLAFSRDQAERIYVQQRMRESAGELWAWLQEGAYFYICGAAAMAKDVEAGLHAIIARQGGMSRGAARAYLAGLMRDGRYSKDAY